MHWSIFFVTIQVGLSKFNRIQLSPNIVGHILVVLITVVFDPSAHQILRAFLLTNFSNFTEHLLRHAVVDGVMDW